MASNRRGSALELAKWWLVGALCTSAAHAFALSCAFGDRVVLQDPEIEGDVAAVVGAPLALDVVRLSADQGGPMYLTSLREVPTGTHAWTAWAELPDEAWVEAHP